ncbi:TRAP-type C4-dicarboxylate transport system, substrate-binding protein [Andreprevotia lacus DSM 23236]|uniref:TRAP-type C4-dicarboxylate transport system, substrate-binding protein n=1 Tax=Andreprevotia lacus DSM 23236 TaxID=1121001 RepID=A0A1W1XX88_9NEIS|nr:TRAP transporter substrate-binding protein [Andreprevotia lacus]SMC28546.1 TRAP-type C4-dicarboxylate transport system, substrate-binding protein [Andreprevotia lacus DSM 23236]
MKRALLTLLLTMLAAGPVCADNAADTSTEGDAGVRTLKVIGSWSMLSQYKNYELPFWSQTVPKLSEGTLKAEITPFNDLGLKGGEVLRMMKLGLTDFGTTILSYVSEQDPRAEGVDLAGLTTDLASSHKVADAYLPVLDGYFRKKHGVRVLALWPYSAQELMCTSPIKSLSELKGKKVRVSLRTTSDLIEAYGATTLNIPFDQVYDKMKAGEIDCLITGTLSANTAKLYEVTSHLYNLPLGWSVLMLAVNNNSWEQLTPKEKAALNKGIAQLSSELWQAANAQTELGLACNSGSDACNLPTKGQMTIVAPAAADKARLKQLVKQVVVKRWLERCGNECRDEWNKTAGQAAGVAIP